MPDYSFQVFANASIDITIAAPDEETAIAFALSYAGYNVDLREFHGNKEIVVYEGNVEINDSEASVYRIVDDGEPESNYAELTDFSESFGEGQLEVSEEVDEPKATRMNRWLKLFKD